MSLSAFLQSAPLSESAPGSATDCCRGHHLPLLATHTPLLLFLPPMLGPFQPSYLSPPPVFPATVQQLHSHEPCSHLSEFIRPFLASLHPPSVSTPPSSLPSREGGGPSRLLLVLEGLQRGFLFTFSLIVLPSPPAPFSPRPLLF